MVATLLSGSFVPLQLMPPAVQRVAEFLPFQIFRYVPIEVILNKLPPETILRDYALSLAWLVIAYFAFRWIWREGVRRFSAVGA